MTSPLATPQPTPETPVGRKTGLVSPCVSVCTIDEISGFCKGCLRTKEEIKAWLKATRPQQLLILETLKNRRNNLNKKQGLRQRKITKRQRLKF